MNASMALPILPRPPTIGILPGGTANDVARTLNIPFDIEKATRALVNGKTINIDIPKANDRYFINFFAIGLIANTSDNINEQLKERLGTLSYFLSAVKTTLQPQYYDYRLVHQDNVIQGLDSSSLRGMETIRGLMGNHKNKW